MTIEVDVRKTLGTFALDARFSSAGRLTALFGASGSGKTTLVDLVAGLSRPDAGRIAVDGRVLVDTAARIALPAHRRRIGYVFQDARLFPHLSVRANLLYGRWFTPAAERRAPFAEIVELLGIGALLDRRPAGLSGGERQRVAIGRALLATPRLLLMDEPLAALDEPRKMEVMPYLERLRDETAVPILYVSHSIPEVLRLASRIVVMGGGRVVAEGEPETVLRRLDLTPASAEFEPGCSLDAVVEAQDEAFGLTRLASPAGPFLVPRIEAGRGAVLRLRIRARDVMIATRPPEGLSALNVLPGRIAALREMEGAEAEVTLDCAGATLLARLTRRSVALQGLAPGMAVFAVVKAVSFERAPRPAGIAS
ncbi:molybdenum ABC transporter ATP-binding protein [Aurantimonas sp. Leaf443]|uniref:molybdenum ABC transporter ATP-binding protein n=1 Tax=Aurantimonas sp. Leaf443 TaxID=1736378 RepID=UPI000700D701|nr:molybdenum ABC transporter ATP-binding protein [Aurantimonas sp. Leaf443]KQT85275.1 molybdenum ABC transporter ATP-binding protein [Aurantimonas sp. Leaf443]